MFVTVATQFCLTAGSTLIKISAKYGFCNKSLQKEIVSVLSSKLMLYNIKKDCYKIKPSLYSNMDFVRSHFGKMNLWPVEHFFPHFRHELFPGSSSCFRVPAVLEVPQNEEKSVQLVKGSSFRSDFSHNPYFSKIQINLGIENWLNLPIF